MQNPPERPWYQNGVIVFFVALAALLLFLVIRGDSKDRIPIQLNGQVVTPPGERPYFQLGCFHHYQGTLENGRISVRATGGLAPTGGAYEAYGFDAWPPNKDHLIHLQIPLREMETVEPLRLVITVEAANAKTTFYNANWEDGGWSTPLLEASHPFGDEIPQ